MIIVKTPMRVSLFGGGTDDPAHFKEHGGACLGMAIDKYCWVTVRRLPPFFAHRHRLVYSKVETVKDVSEFVHPLVRTLMSNYGPFNHGLEIHHDADLPARSGMGSSSAFAVGLIHAINSLNGGMLTRKQLADTAIHVERDLIPEAGGWQDQIWSAYGGMNFIKFSANGYSVDPIVISNEVRNELLSSLVLYFTGFARDAHAIEQEKSSKDNTGRLRLMAKTAERAKEMLTSSWSLEKLGQLMKASWDEKRLMATSVTTPQIDEMYAAGLRAGALGGKLLGAGGGGFMLFVVPYHSRAKLRNAMQGLIEINFDVDYDGSKLVLYQPNGL